MEGFSRSFRPFQGLSEQLIEKILLRLDVKERVRSMLVCKRFLELGKQGTLLWESVACTPKKGEDMRKVLDWIVAHHHQLRRISLRPSEVYHPALLPLWGMMTSSFVLAARTLISLDFSLLAEVELSGWIIPLTGLRWLSVSAPRIVVSSDVGQLKHLRTLQLSTMNAEDATECTMDFAEGSIPVGLRALVLEDMFLGELPPTVTQAAVSLTRLRLDINYSVRFFEEGSSPGSIKGLARLTELKALKVLELQHCDSETLPQELTALTNLTFLCLSWSFFTHPPANLLLLSGLSKLSVLNMQYCQLTSLDAELDGLDHLQTLCLSGNPALALPTASAWLPFLLELDVDLETAVENSSVIGSLGSLRQLCLNGYNSRPHKPLDGPRILALIHSLCILPQLRSLYFKNCGQQVLTESVEAMAAFAKFLRCRPEVEMRAATHCVGNPFDDAWLTWDKVETEEDAQLQQ